VTTSNKTNTQPPPTDALNTNQPKISKLLAVMAQLRDPDGGCPWDLEQTFQTIAPHTIEEAYEVADAIARGNLVDLQDELGDLLLQVVYHAQMAEEQRAFNFDDVVESITHKLIRRHPHVFANVDARTAEAVGDLWEQIKAEEKSARHGARTNGALADVPVALPALTRALKLQNKAGQVGFDWNDPLAVLAKIREEADEIEAELLSDNKLDAAAEVGDLLFAVANLARHLKADPEGVLRATNAKFERRFAFIEAALAARGQRPESATLAEMNELWNRAKSEERSEEKSTAI
jgi:ATP diphosphatase